MCDEICATCVTGTVWCCLDIFSGICNDFWTVRESIPRPTKPNRLLHQDFLYISRDRSHRPCMPRAVMYMRKLPGRRGRRRRAREALAEHRPRSAASNGQRSRGRGLVYLTFVTTVCRFLESSV
ncbi:hypothetical protein C8Q70DRAFT_70799 [Cubamyces menziesii]|nr:hypothetical protein C8Q70DRAFT_70799 [Cubamyces menziesii]